MTYAYRRIYRGPIQAALLDWAGTTMDDELRVIDQLRAAPLKCIHEGVFLVRIE